MGVSIACLMLSAVVAQPAAPSVAVFSLRAQTGVDERLTELVTGLLVAELRKTGAFSRVTAAAELEALLGFERQKQLLDCAADSCMTELAGSLGVDFIVVGGLGKVANSWVVDLKMLDVKKSALAAPYSERLRGVDEDSVLDVLPKAAAQFAAAVGRGVSPPPEKPPAPPVPPTPPVPPATPETPATTGNEAGGPNVPLLAAGGAGLAVAALGTFGALALVAGAVAVKALLNFVYVPELKEGTYGFIGAYVGMGVMGVIVGGVAVLLGLAGAGLLAAGVTL